jgi:membrane protein YdbS with pleckstrin-like domain
MLMLNMFGMDRGGFRCLILMPAERTEVLLGRNAAMLPIVGGIAILFGLGLFYVAPIGIWSIVASGCQMLIAFMMVCIVGNWVSIQFPIAMVPGTGKPAQVNMVTMLVQMVVTFCCPVFIIPGVLFFGIEWSLNYFFSVAFLPVFALLSLVELWLVYKMYRHVLERQGRLLQSRETRILELLTAHSE